MGGHVRQQKTWGQGCKSKAEEPSGMGKGGDGK